MKHFQSFRLDTINQCLWRGEKRVSLTPKAFDVLRYLVERSDRLVTQDEILEALWSETYVNPEVVKKYILEIRKVLGDNPDRPAFVQTFPKRGYQFVAPVTDEASPASLDSTGEQSRNIVGREVALSGLDDLIRKALRGQRQIIFVTGEAGIGKTTLIDEFERRASRIPKLKFARGQCVEGFGGKEAYPFFQALGQLVRAPDSSAVVEALTKRAPTWMVQFSWLVKRQERDALQRD